MTPATALPDPAFRPEFYTDTGVKRIIAWVIDTAVIIGMILIVLPFTGFLGIFFLPILYLVIGFAYRVWTLSRRSATLGMRLMAIEFRDSRGDPFDLTHAVLHTLGFTITASMILPHLASITLMALTPRGQGLSDLVLGTAAINRPANS